MNGQRRDYGPLNSVKKVQVIKNYRGYKLILFVKPFANSYIGYLDDDFFGFIVTEKDSTEKWMMDARQAIDYYLDKLFFKDSGGEYVYFKNNPEYKQAFNSLLLKKGKR